MYEKIFFLTNCGLLAIQWNNFNNEYVNVFQIQRDKL